MKSGVLNLKVLRSESKSGPKSSASEIESGFRIAHHALMALSHHIYSSGPNENCSAMQMCLVCKRNMLSFYVQTYNHFQREVGEGDSANKRGSIFFSFNQ